MIGRNWLIYGFAAAFRLALCLAVSFAFVAGMAAQEQGAQDYVAAIYANYQGADPRGLPVNYASESSLRAYFEDSLAVLIRDDKISPAIEAGRLVFDPFVESRDTDLNAVNISIRVGYRPADRVIAVVTFARDAEKIKEVRLDLVRQGREWRIDNIHWDERDLRTLLTRNRIRSDARAIVPTREYPSDPGQERGT